MTARADRAGRLAQAMARHDFDALLVVGCGLLKHHAYVDWLLGPVPPTRPARAVLLPGPRLTAFVGAEGDAAALAPGPDLAVQIAADPMAAAAALLGGAERTGLRLGIVGRDHLMPAGEWLALRAALPAARLEDATHVADEVRAVKDEEEMEGLRAAARLAAAAFTAAVAAVRPGVTPVGLAAAGHAEARRLGARDALILVGDGLHHGGVPADVPLAPGSLVTIFAETLGPTGYWAEEGGMVAVGALDAARERLAQTVLAALGAGEQVLRAGAATADVARAMAAPAEGIGAVAGLCHSLGHGVGVGDADLPRIAPGDSGVLEPGMVLVAHPTISDRTAGVSAAAGGTYLVGEARAVRLAPVPALQRVEAG